MTLKRFELIEHTADIGLRAFGKDKKGLFENAAQGMFSIIIEPKLNRQQGSRSSTQQFDIALKADNLEELLVFWLSELLSLFDVNQIFFRRYNIKTLTDTKITAQPTAESVDIKNYELKAEIKAVTYHRLKIQKKDKTWQAEVIFDI